jgi:hypothetical protein
MFHVAQIEGHCHTEISDVTAAWFKLLLCKEKNHYQCITLSLNISRSANLSCAMQLILHC